MHRRTGCNLGGRVGYVTRHVWQLFKVKSSNVKVTRSRNVSSDRTLNSAVNDHINLKLGGNYRREIDAGILLGQYVKQTGSRNTVDIHLIKCKN